MCESRSTAKGRGDFRVLLMVSVEPVRAVENRIWPSFLEIDSCFKTIVSSQCYRKLFKRLSLLLPPGQFCVKNNFA